jgi:phosphoribosylanthranilate isomerase
LEDAQVAVDAGADALGFVFYEKSPRYVTAEQAREITRHLPERVEKVGVFVNESGESMEEIASGAGLTAVQVNVDVVQDVTWSPTKRKLYLAIQARSFAGDLWIEKSWKQADAILVDSGTGQERGGTGKTFDWNEARKGIADLSQSVPVIVAGGLTPGNVREAIAFMEPWGVDVSSGVERVPGRKDADKVRAFVAAVRGAEADR